MIQAQSLTRKFGELVAVHDLSFEVREGELFGIVGPDGAGKTTTLRMLAGVLRPTSGDATLAGTSVAQDPERVKHDLAYMSQRFGLYTDLSVMQNLQFYADLYRVPRAERDARLKRLFEFSGLAPFRDRLAGNLSGGMKQKLGLSCALVHRPKILLLDEPTFGVDPVSRRELWLIVHEMVSEGVTAVVSTAYMDEAERFDRLILVNRGKRIAMDTPDALRDAFEGVLVEVRTTTPRAAREVAAAQPFVRNAVMFGDRIHAALEDEAAIPHLESALRAAGQRDLRIRAIAASLEDVFVNRVTAAEAAG